MDTPGTSRGLALAITHPVRVPRTRGLRQNKAFCRNSGPRCIVELGSLPATAPPAGSLRGAALWTPDSATPNSTAASLLAFPLPFLSSSGFAWTTEQPVRARGQLPGARLRLLTARASFLNMTSAGPPPPWPRGARRQLGAQKGPLLGSRPSLSDQAQDSKTPSAEGWAVSSGLYSHCRATVTFNTYPPHNLLPYAAATRS